MPLFAAAAAALAATCIGQTDAYTTLDATVASSLWASSFFVALIDVRTTEEWDEGHLPNATLVASMHETGDTSRLEGCKDCPLAIYCRTGRRSKLAADVMEADGFTNVYDVLGITQWTEEAGVELVMEEERDPECCTAECPASGAVSVGRLRRVVIAGSIAAALAVTAI